jgi:WD40 repeat protein
VQDTNGQIHHWHATSEMHLGMTKEEGNEIYAVDFHPIGVKFATAGLDSKVRIYDGVTQKPLQILSEGNGTTTAGHSNRVFAVKWHPADIHITLSGGWDNTTQVGYISLWHNTMLNCFLP